MMSDCPAASVRGTDTLKSLQIDCTFNFLLTRPSIVTEEWYLTEKKDKPDFVNKLHFDGVRR